MSGAIAPALLPGGHLKRNRLAGPEDDHARGKRVWATFHGKAPQLAVGAAEENGSRLG
jgi:hypothetical protein